MQTFAILELTALALVPLTACFKFHLQPLADRF